MPGKYDHRRGDGTSATRRASLSAALLLKGLEGASLWRMLQDRVWRGFVGSDMQNLGILTRLSERPLAAVERRGTYRCSRCGRAVVAVPAGGAPQGVPHPVEASLRSTSIQTQEHLLSLCPLRFSVRGCHLATGSKPHFAPAGTPSDNCHLAYVAQGPRSDRLRSSRYPGSTQVEETARATEAAAA